MRARRTLGLSLTLPALLLSLLPAAVAGAVPAAAATSCPTGWGSLPEAGGDLLSTGRVTAVRTGRHACFDRVVVDVAGRTDDYRARYVPRVHTEGRGEPLTLRGAADLELVVGAAQDPARAWPRPGRDLVGTGAQRTVQQVVNAGSFEGQTTVAVGVRARLPFRVTLLPGPGDRTRVVLDVAHRW